MKQLKLLCLFIFTAPSIFAQSGLPVIRASSRSVTINDGGVITKGSWTLSPQAKPDIYTADRSRRAKWVSFYTDTDSIRVKVKPGSRFDFVVLLNGKDSCFTQIASAIAPDAVNPPLTKSDTIPFRLTAYNAIAVKALVNGTDTVNLHVDISSSGIHFLRNTLTGKLKQQQVKSLQIGNMTWNNPAILPVSATAHEMDGRIGYTVFEGKQVEINYDLNLLIIHSRLPKTKGYLRTKLGFSHSFAYVNAAFKVGQQTYKGIFTLDNGSEQALILDSAWSARSNFTQQFKLLRTSAISDSRGKKYETKIMQAPLFALSKFELPNVPATIFSTRNPAGFELNFLGNDVLKRFNMILDLKNDEVYFRANKRLQVPYRENVRG